MLSARGRGRRRFLPLLLSGTRHSTLRTRLFSVTCRAPHPSHAGDHDLLAARQVLAGQRQFALVHLARCSLRGDRAAEPAGAGPEVIQAVGRLQDFAIMLDHDDGVAEITQLLECRQQPAVVTRMQSDRRFIEHIQHAGECPADLAGQANSLCLAAGQRRQCAGECQIVQSDIDQERQPRRRFAQQVAGDPLLRRIQLETAQEFQGIAQRQIAQLLERLAAELHRGGIVAQAAAVARRTRHLADDSEQFHAVVIRQRRRLLDRGIQALVLEGGLRAEC